MSLASCLARLGFTRDMAAWFWLRLLSAAALVTSLTSDDITRAFNYVGVPLTPTWEHRLVVAAIALLWIAGKQDRSWLPSTDEKQSVTPPKS